MWQTIKPILTYGGTFFVGLLAGGALMQRAIKSAMTKQAEAMMGGMGGMDPQALEALAQQMQAGGNPMGGALDMTSVAPQMSMGMPQAQNNVALPAVKKDYNIAPLNITASQLGTGGRLSV